MFDIVLCWRREFRECRGPGGTFVYKRRAYGDHTPPAR
jgi:hypothetical protein